MARKAKRTQSRKGEVEGEKWAALQKKCSSSSVGTGAAHKEVKRP